jgi:xanthine dehydrogenase molybdopterin-binding subunit B
MPRDNRLTIAGRPLPRLDAPAKVTGSQVYGADVVLPGMLWGRLLRSPVPAAAIRRLDPRPALALDGVRAVVTADDIPRVRYGPAVKDMEALARGNCASRMRCATATRVPPAKGCARSALWNACRRPPPRSAGMSGAPLADTAKASPAAGG